MKALMLYETFSSRYLSASISYGMAMEIPCWHVHESSHFPDFRSSITGNVYLRLVAKATTKAIKEVIDHKSLIKGNITL